jgi:hypothetical protein
LKFSENLALHETVFENAALGLIWVGQRCSKSSIQFQVSHLTVIITTLLIDSEKKKRLKNSYLPSSIIEI